MITFGNITECGKWQETTAKDHDYALNVLPPLEWKQGGFFISEPYDFGGIHSFHQEYKGKYYKAFYPISKPRKEILEELYLFIGSKEV